MSIGLLILRLAIGALFIGHGTQKLFGWFGGGGRAGTSRMLEGLGYRDPGNMAIVAGVTEFASGALLAVGLITPFAVAGIIGVMLNAISTKVANGFWNTNGGYELPFVLAVSVWAIAWTGPGAYSLDYVTGIRFAGTGAAFIVAFLAGGVAGFVEITMRTARTRDVDIPRVGRHRKAA